MKLQLEIEIQKNKVALFLELIKSFNFIKSAKPIEGESTTKAEIINNIKEAVEELNLIRAGKKHAHNAEDFLNEL